MAATDDRDPCDDFEHLQKELADYDQRLTDKPFLVVGNKNDEEKAEENMQRFRKRFPKIQPFFISAVLEDGLEPLRQSLLKHLR
jgi:GTP-binding protein